MCPHPFTCLGAVLLIASFLAFLVLLDVRETRQPAKTQATTFWIMVSLAIVGLCSLLCGLSLEREFCRAEVRRKTAILIKTVGREGLIWVVRDVDRKERTVVVSRLDKRVTAHFSRDKNPLVLDLWSLEYHTNSETANGHYVRVFPVLKTRYSSFTEMPVGD